MSMIRKRYTKAEKLAIVNESCAHSTMQSLKDESLRHQD